METIIPNNRIPDQDFKFKMFFICFQKDSNWPGIFMQKDYCSIYYGTNNYLSTVRYAFRHRQSYIIYV